MADTAITPNTGAIAATGIIPLVGISWTVFLSLGSMATATSAITVTEDASQVGTPIANSNASTVRINHKNACDYSGFRAMPGELISNSEGMMVLPEFWEEPHVADFTRYVWESNAVGPLRREPVGDEVFIATAVTVDDL